MAKGRRNRRIRRYAEAVSKYTYNPEDGNNYSKRRFARRIRKGLR